MTRTSIPTPRTLCTNSAVLERVPDDEPTRDVLGLLRLHRRSRRRGRRQHIT